ncbi:MAG: purine-nucleoside phosphorylase [Acidobacteria bacterium]|nr:purine-nucleoside phosphorylase [Acidobacteriota bacterium]
MIGKIREAVDYIHGKFPSACEVGVILGSGLGAFAEQIENPVVIPFGDIPNFPVSSVAGHAGKLFLGRLKGKTVALMQGRVHYYEGHDPTSVIFPCRVLRQLGVRSLVVTNAAGGINVDFSSGVLMLISDHLNLMGFNPLRGKNEEAFGARFPDMTFAYDPELRALARDVAKGQGMDLKEGVYVGLQGPSYETPAEIRMLRTLGADAVGMSTVPEVIAANQMGVKVVAISCITNMAAGILNQKLSHEEVMETTARVQRDFVKLLAGIVERL